MDSKITRETKTDVNRLAARPKLRVTANPRTGPVPNREQDDGGNDRGHVGIDNRDPGVSEALVHRRRRCLAVPQLLANALEDQHVGIHAHTDGQDDTRDSGQGERRSGETEEAQQDDQVQEQPQVRVDARPPGNRTA